MTATIPHPLPTIELDGSRLTVADIAQVATRRASVRLSDSGFERARRSFEAATTAAGDRPLYGRSTGVGANRTVQVSGNGSAHALSLLRSHATSAGDRRAAERVRALLLVRLNQLAAGGSGVDPAVLSGLARMISVDALPEVLELGSIGTGDLSALATTALTLLGERAASRELPGRIDFGPADGLAFLSSNAAALADAALAVTSLTETATAAIAVAALTFDAVEGNAEAYSIAALLATPFPGAAAVCAHLRRLLGANEQGVRRNAAGAQRTAARIQDPFGLRALPQSFGPVLDALSAATAVIEASVNAPTENPLVVPGPRDAAVAHHGGFHAAYLQLALDGLKLAVAQSGQLVLGRLALLVEPSFTGLAPFLGDGTPGASGVMSCEYVAASALGAIRAAAYPAGLQTAVLSRGVEEDASFASLAATQCLTVARLWPHLLACELVAAVRAQRMLPGRPAVGRIAEIMTVGEVLSGELADRDLTDDLACAAGLLPALANVVRLSR